MALDIENPTHERRPYGFVVLGLLLLGVAGFLANDARRRTVHPVDIPSAYEYTIDQAVKTDVTYFKNSFYENGPGAGNTAYVAELTDKLKASFHYTYKASQETELTHTYFVKALVSGQYVVGADGKDTSDVWSKEYLLVRPRTEKVMTNSLRVDEDVEVPFSEYRKLVDQLKTSLTIPIAGQVSIVFSSQVSGNVDGASISDVRVSTVSAPLDQPLYKVANKFDKNDTKQVASQQEKQGEDNYRQYELIAAGVLAILGLAGIVYGLRKQIFKSAYQRELEKIYRYHDGIIIKAHKAADHEGLRVVPVQSFDDMLNLEEEIKEPIVASPAGGEATRFSIVRGDVIYVYTLGKALIEEESFDRVETGLDEERKKPQRKKIHLK